ncbi:MAG TPA: TetR/AcrR family transcriptional regulator [Pseudonocardiaceae bacterium]|nr:TetR/AcrR family transcriptional regulator [Pseudonocardiaceae bacterium]
MTATEVPGTRATRRTPERRAAICDSVFALLAEVGYDRMTMDAVAARAHVSKATIYRNWPDKPDLVADALSYHFSDAPVLPDTGSLRGDLLAVLTRACQAGNGLDGEVIVGVMTAAARNPMLAKTMHEAMYEKKHGMHEALIGRAVRRGEVPPGTDPHLLHEVLHSMLLTRRLECYQLDDAYARHVVDDVLIPVLSRHVM